MIVAGPPGAAAATGSASGFDAGFDADFASGLTSPPDLPQATAAHSTIHDSFIGHGYHALRYSFASASPTALFPQPEHRVRIVALT